MSQRNSGYERIPKDTYVTPQWVWEILYEHEPWAKTAIDICPVDYRIDAFSLLDDAHAGGYYYANVASNTPYGALGPKIVRHTLPVVHRAAFLFPSDWDCAKGRKHLFTEPQVGGAIRFKCKYVLTKRIRWENIEQKKANPSGNHAWYVWDRAYTGVPQMRVL